ALPNGRSCTAEIDVGTRRRDRKPGVLGGIFFRICKPLSRLGHFNSSKCFSCYNTNYNRCMQMTNPDGLRTKRPPQSFFFEPRPHRGSQALGGVRSFPRLLAAPAKALYISRPSRP